MTRAHAARCLLALGPLTFREFAAVTGWPRGVCSQVLYYLADRCGQVQRAGKTYQLTND